MGHIKRIIEMTDESVSETLNRMGMITEMAVPLKKYRERVDGLRFQLVENWCLCKYCQLFDALNVNFKHWTNELKSVIDNLKFLDIKGEASKGRLLEKMLVSDYDYKDSGMIKRIIAGKFKKENISDPEKVESVCSAFAGGVDDIISVISDNDAIVVEYLLDTFGLPED